MSVMIVLVIVLLHVTLDHGSTDHDERRQNAVEFWINTICHTKATKMINLHGILSNESLLLLFFNEFARGIYEECETAIVLSTYAIDESGNKERHLDSDTSRMKEFPTRDTLRTISTKRLDKVHDRKMKRRDAEKIIFNVWSLHVILARDERSIEQILNWEASVDWTARLHFIVLIISDDMTVDADGTIERVLKTFWLKRQILNVLLFVPFAKTGENSMYTYNPFVFVNANNDDDNGNDDRRGKVESINVASKDDIFKCLSTLTHRRTNDMHGYELRVALFEQFQSLMKITETPKRGSIFEYSAGYGGVDGIILGTIAKYMNFRVKVVKSSDGIKFGHELPNGTYVGTIGDVVYGRADVSFDSFFVKSYGKSKHSFEFTSHTEYDSICVFVPKARKIPKWLRIHHMFEPSIWFCSIISPIIVYLMCLLLRLFTTRRITSLDRRKLAYEVFQFTVGYPAKLSSLNPERILLFALAILNVTIAGLFGGLLYKSLASDMYYKDIDRLAELDASGLPIVFSKYSLNDVFGEEPIGSPILASLKKKLRYGRRGMEDAATFRNASGFIRKRHYYLIRREIVDEVGSPKLHLVKECPGTYYLGYPLPKNSYLLDKLNLLVGRLDQAGLLTLWTNRTIVDLIYRRRIAAKKIKALSSDEFVPFKLTDMQTAFYLLTAGLTLASIVFCDERGWLRKRAKRKRASLESRTRRR